MPMINVSVALTSPMLVDTFTVKRRVQTVGTNGRATTTNTPTTGVSGVVYPSDNNDLQRLGDMQVTGKAITVITQFALRGESEESGTPEVQFQPDIVTWHGNSFVVKHLEDWGAFGPGFVLAVCTSIDIVDAPPTTTG